MDKKNQNQKQTATETNVVKGDKKGYAFLGRLKGCPDFGRIARAQVVRDEAGHVREIVLKKGEKAGAMLKHGYVNVGKGIEAHVEFKDNEKVILKLAA
jgi:hypothetical protein